MAQTKFKTGGGCNPKGIDKEPRRGPLCLTDPEEWEKQRAADRLKHEQWLLMPEGQKHLADEKVRQEREALKISNEEWSRLHSELLQRGFQAGDVAVLENGTITPTIHGHTGRRCLYVQISCLINLYDRPKFIINPAHWRGALVCFVDGYKNGDAVKQVKCISRGPRSAWVKVVNP